MLLGVVSGREGKHSSVQSLTSAGGELPPAVRLSRPRFSGTLPDIVWMVLGNVGSVRAVAFSPNGQTLAVTSGSAIRMIRVSDGALLRILQGHTNDVHCLAFSPDGQTLVSGSADSAVKIWRVSDWTVTRTLSGHAGGVVSVALTPDGQTLAASTYQQVKLWRVADGMNLKTWNAHSNFVDCVTFSPDGQILASAGRDGAIRFWTMPDATPLREWMLGGYVYPISLAFSPDGQTLLCGGWGGSLTLWKVSDGALIRTLPSSGGDIQTVAFSPDGQTLAASDVRGIKIYSVNGGPPLQTLAANSWVQSVAFSPDGSLLASGGSDGAYKLWRLSDGQMIQTLTGHAAGVRAIAFSPDGQLVASGDFLSHVKLWRAADGTFVRNLIESSAYGEVTSLAFSPDGQTLAVSHWYEPFVKLWRVSDGTLIRKLAGHNYGVSAVAFSPDGQTLASCSGSSGDGRIILWRTSDWTSVRSWVGHQYGTYCLAFSPDGSLIASGGHDDMVKIWRVSDGTLAHILTHGEIVLSVAFSPDGQTLASGSYPDVKLWRVSDGTPMRSLTGNKDYVNSLAFTPDGQALITASEDSVIKLWRVSDGVAAATYTEQDSMLMPLALSPNGQFFAYGLDDGSVKMARMAQLQNHAPAAPTLLFPADSATLDALPTFQLKATDQDINPLRFKIELSQDNFQTVAKTYDGVQSIIGWNKASYANDETATFVVPIDDPISAGSYQWRAFAFDGRDWSGVSATRSFMLQLVQPLVSTVSPNTVYQTTSRELRIGGVNFKAGLQVWLEKAGVPNLFGANVILEGDRVITAQFNLANAAAGKWAVAVRNPDGQSGRLPDGFTVIAPCDLVLQELSIDPSQNIADGQTVTARVKLKNVAATDAVGTIEVTFEAWGQKVSVPHRGGLGTGEEVMLSAPLTAKAGNDGELRVTADPTNAITESNESNNVANLSLPVVPFPDLTLTNLEFEPKTPRSGDTVRVSATVKNVGGNLINPFFVAFFADDKQLQLEPWYEPLDMGKEVKVSIHFRAYAGIQNIKAQADPTNDIAETDENNNETSTPFAAMTKPDLAATELQVSPSSPNGGSWVTLAVKVKNVGAGEQGGGFGVRFLVDGALLGATYYPYNLRQNEEVVVNSTVRWRAQVGQHAMSAVIDPTDEVAETNEQNNTAQQTINIQPADLIVPDPQLESQNLVVGAEVTVNVTVKNTGTGSAGAFIVALFEGDRFVNSRWVSGVASGSSQAVPVTWRVRSGLSALRVVADVNNTVAESDENNNEASLPLPTIQPPDFVVSDLNFAPTAPVQGDDINIQATVRNMGAPFNGRVDVRFKWNSYTLFTRVTLSAQNPQAVATTTIQIPVQSQAVALPTLEVTADPTNVFPESDENNNTQTQATNLSIAPPDLTIAKITVQAPQPPILSGNNIPVVVEVQNVGAPCKGTFDLLLSVDGRQVDAKQVQMTGAAGEKKDVPMSWEAQPGTSFDFRAQVNVSDALTNNNALTQTVALKVMGPDFTVTKLEFAPQSGVKLNDAVTFTVGVKNVGLGSYNKPVPVYLHVSGKSVREGVQFLNGLAANEEKTLTFTWIASEQARPRATAIADSYSQIQETDETNNSMTIDLPFDVAKEDAYEVVLKPAEQTCPISAQTTYTATVKSWITVPTIFDLSVEGLPTGWCALSSKEVYLQAGEWKDVTFTVTPPSDATLEEKAFQIKATRRGTTDAKAADGKAIVAASTNITDLLPEDGQTLPSDTVTFAWRTAVSSSSEVFLKAEDEANFRRYDGAVGTFHQVVVSGLNVGKRYDFYAQSKSNGVSSQSVTRAILIAGGVVFTQKNYTFNVQRDWMQTVTVGVRNLSNQMMQAVASVENPYHPEIVVGFGGSGSVDGTMTLAPNETKEITLAIHAATAARTTYDLPIKVRSGSDASPLVDVATVKVQVPLKADLELQELGTDPVTLVKKFRLINKSDVPVADVRLELDDNLKGKAAIRPQTNMLRLEPKSSVEFEVVPVFELAAHRNAQFAAALKQNRAMLVNTPEANARRQQAIGGSVRAVSGAGSAQQTTNYSLGDRDIYAVMLWNRHIERENILDVCTNMEHVSSPVDTPPIDDDDVADPFLLVSLESRVPSGQGWSEKPHDVYFKVNGYPVGSINNEVPQGVYTFNVPKSVLNLSPTNTTQQSIEIDTKVYNGAHYWRVGRMALHVFVNEMVVYVAAKNQEEALRIAQNQPYFAAHEDTNFDKVRAAIKAYVTRHAADWWKTLDWEPVPWSWGAGELNNWYYFNNTDPSTKRFLAEYRCIGWTKNLMDEFARLKGRGELNGIRVSAAKSWASDHNYVVMWKEGTNPIDTGIVIDPWMKEQYADLPLKQALQMGAYTHGGGMVANILVADEAGYFNTDYSSIFGDDYKELFQTLTHYKQERVRLYAPMRQSLQTNGGAPTPPSFFISVKGAVYTLVTTSEGKQFGWLPSGEFVNDLGNKLATGQSEELAAAVMMVEGLPPSSWEVNISPAAAQTVTVKLGWRNQSNEIVTATYEDVPVGQVSGKSQGAALRQGQLQGAVLTIDFSQPPQPFVTGDGQKIYPHIPDETAAEAAIALAQPMRQILPAGLNMIALPAYVQGVDPATILDAPNGDLKMARWSPETLAYRLYPDTFVAAMEMGKGYWVKLPRTTPVELFTPIAAKNKPFSIALKPGWNQVGNPSQWNMAWDLTTLKVRRNGQELTLAQAQQAGWIEDFAWGFQQNADNPNTGRYVLIYDSGILPGVVNQLAAWTGCWVKAYVDCELICPPQTANATSLSRALSRRKPTRSEWLVTLSAETFGAKDSVSFGASPLARSSDFSRLQIAKPPAAPGQANFEMFLVPADRAATVTERLGVDVRHNLSAKEQWLLVVRGALPNADVTLRWNDLGNAPRPLRFRLIDETTGTRRYMRTTNGYTFRAGAAGEERKFRIELDGRPQGARLLNHLSVVNNGQGAHFSFVLSQPATVNARIITPTGKIAAVIARGVESKPGLNALTWNGKASSGASLPRGIYIIEVTAVTEEGQAMREVRTFALR
jgi:WD40 repeat protein/subtilase family serine protease